MRNPDRIDILLEKVRELWKSSPDLRFGQMVYILSHQSKIDQFNIEDDEWLKILDTIIERYKK